MYKIAAIMLSIIFIGTLACAEGEKTGNDLEKKQTSKTDTVDTNKILKPQIGC